MLHFITIYRFTCQFTQIPGIELNTLCCRSGNKWRGRATMQTLSATPVGGDPLPDPFAATEEEEEPEDDPGKSEPPKGPTLPTPTDVPVPEPWDIPPPDPKDPRPRSVP